MTKITRDSFIYMEPDGTPPNDFAQCVSCRKYVPERVLEGKIHHDCCIEFGSDTTVGSRWSCGLYSPWPKGKVVAEVIKNHAKELLGGLRKAVNPKDAGLVNREVRCENCRFFAPIGRCGLFSALNQAMRNIFNLEELVKSKGCCNAQTPSDDRAPVHRVIKSKMLEKV